MAKIMNMANSNHKELRKHVEFEYDVVLKLDVELYLIKEIFLHTWSLEI